MTTTHYRFIFRYTLFGVVFGLCFPLFSWAMDAVVFHSLSFTWPNIVYIHKINPLHCIIDTAPFFLGISFGYAGRKQDAITSINKDLEIQVKDRTEANRVKDKMLSIISHDLRSPLSALAGTLELLKQGALSEADRAVLLSRISVDVEYTNELLENLLSWAASKDSGAGHRPEKFYLLPTMNNIVALFDSTARSKQITINNLIQADHAVYADPNMINLVIRNLISNAIKFTCNNGTVTILSEMTGNAIRITVRDTGVGMSNEKIEQLFNADQGTVTTRGTANEKGTGIGLLLCKDFIEKHNSKFRIKSIPEKGTEFSFDLQAGV